jgi:2-polyprenyl-3-methyl-5-hydroxy-6-metoxy-1,4-benzoquinol methylase
LLGARFGYDGVPLLRLNDLQLRMRDQVERKVASGHYRFEKVPCCVCSSSEFETLATKDRYGLYMPIVICTRCGLIQTNPRMDQSSYSEFYNLEYRRLYNGTETASEAFFSAQRARGRRIFEYLKRNRAITRSPGELSVLEVGCGAGGILQYFRDMGAKVRGVDLGTEYLEYGRSEYGLDLIQGTVADIPADPRPDIVIYSHVLEHILVPHAELLQIHRTLSDEGGILYIEVPGVRHLLHSYNMDFLRYAQNAHVYHFTLTSLTNLLRLSGFEIAAGSEEIRSVFRKAEGGNSGPSRDFVVDHDSVLKYLWRVERIRKLCPFPPSRILRLPRSLAFRIATAAHTARTPSDR